MNPHYHIVVVCKFPLLYAVKDYRTGKRVFGPASYKECKQWIQS